MGGSTECLPCPVGWLCSEGLGVPCGYGTSLSTATTNVQEEEGSTSSTSGVYGGACASCPEGTACPGAGLVGECSRGMFSPGGGPSNMCMPCPPGSFANSSGASACDDCPAGERKKDGRERVGCVAVRLTSRVGNWLNVLPVVAQRSTA